MPLSRTIDPHNRFLRTTITAPLGIVEAEQHLNVVFGMGVGACPELIDARQILDPVDLSARQVLMALQHFGLGRDEFAPRALVVSSETLFSVARTVSTLVSSWVRIGVFYDMDAACEWLRHHSSSLSSEAWRAALSRADAAELSETA